MSYYRPDASKIKIEKKDYDIVYGLDYYEKNDHRLQDTLDVINHNKIEIDNWATFFRYYGKGIVSFSYKNGIYSYPPKYIQGRQLYGFSSEFLNDLDNINIHEKYMFALYNEDIKLFHIMRVSFSEELRLLTKRPKEFDEYHSLEDDNREILESTNALFIKSEEAYLNNDYELSLKYINELILENPNYSRAYTARGCIYELFQDHRYALANYFDAIDINSNNWRAYYNAGNLYFYFNQYALGLKYIAKCIEINPNYKKAVYRYANFTDWLNSDIDDAIKEQMRLDEKSINNRFHKIADYVENAIIGKS